MPNGLRTPGSRSSEFLVTILNVLAQLILALTDTISNGTATKLGVLGTIAYRCIPYTARPHRSPHGQHLCACRFFSRENKA